MHLNEVVYEKYFFRGFSISRDFCSSPKAVKKVCASLSSSTTSKWDWSEKMYSRNWHYIRKFSSFMMWKMPIEKLKWVAILFLSKTRLLTFHWLLLDDRWAQSCLQRLQRLVDKIRLRQTLEFLIFFLSQFRKNRKGWSCSARNAPSGTVPRRIERWRIG